MSSTVRRIAQGFAVAAFVVPTCVACGGSSTPPPTSTTSTTAAPVVLTLPAMNRIALARCIREGECGDLERDHGSRDRCLAKMTHDIRSTLNDAACPSGVDGTRLDQCLAAVDGERCGDPADKAAREMACRRAQLCLH